VLYVGEAPFWSAMRANGDDPTGDLRAEGPRLIGRFDLATETWLPPLDATRAGSRSGVWDVHVDRAGQVWFTSFYEPGGRVDPRSGAVTHFDAAGPGLNELAPGPGDRVLVSRYGSGEGGRGSGELLTLDRSGEIASRWPLPAPSGYQVAPKTPAWNAGRRRLVATTDLIPTGGGAIRHDAYQLDAEGTAWQRSQDPELQFVAATDDGTEYRVEAHASSGLWLRRIDPEGGRREVLLDPSFPAAHDFAQDLKFAEGDRVVVTRWSGAVHVVDAAGAVSTLRLPKLDPDGLYYTAVIRGDRVCATHCADVTVVCADVP
jgi:streptogramin lyase